MRNICNDRTLMQVIVFFSSRFFLLTQKMRAATPFEPRKRPTFRQARWTFEEGAINSFNKVKLIFLVRLRHTEEILLLMEFW